MTKVKQTKYRRRDYCRICVGFRPPASTLFSACSDDRRLKSLKSRRELRAMEI
jgi:hypothetical protein